MTIVQWIYRGEIMTDYHFKWMNISKHFKGVCIWAVEWHWKDSNISYHNLSRHVSKSHVWSCSRLTLRLGTYIITVGVVDLADYYKTVKILKVSVRGKGEVRLKHMWQCPVGDCNWSAYNLTEKEKAEHLEKHEDDASYLEKAYPDKTHMN